MADDKPTSYAYRVLVPRLPSAEGFAEGEQITYEVVGDFEARTPDAAIEAAAEVRGIVQGAEDAPVRTIAIPLKSWHERSVEVETQLLFKVSKVDPVEPDAETV